MEIEYGEWTQRKEIYIDFKKMPGNVNSQTGEITSWIVKDDSSVLRITKAVQRIFDRWQIGIITCDTERDPRDIQVIRVLGSAKNYPNIGSSVVEITYLGDLIRPMGEDSFPRPISVFCNRFPISMRNEAGAIQVFAHAIGHAFGLEHNPDTTSIMNPFVSPVVKTFKELEIAWLDVTANRDFAMAMQSPDPLSVMSSEHRKIYERMKDNFGKRCECEFSLV